MMVDFYKNILIIGDRKIELPFLIDDLIILKGKIIVLFYYMEKKDSFNNIWALDNNGRKVWEVSLPIQNYYKGNDSYTKIEISLLSKTLNNLIAYSWSGYRCIINLNDGKIKKQIFIKE